MDNTNSKIYVLYVASAEVSAQAGSLSTNESRELYVEIRLDQTVVQVTEAVKRSNTLAFNEALPVVSKGSSTVSLSVISGPYSQGLRIGSADIAFDALVAKCADNEFAILEMKSEAMQPPTGVLMVKLNERPGLHEPAMIMDTLGANQLRLFQRLGELSYSENAILNMAKAVELTDDEHPNKPGRLSNLGVAQKARFDRLSNISDLQSAVLNMERAVELMKDGDPNKPGLLLNLGNIQQTRFGHIGNISDLENSISNIETAVDLTDDGHPSKANRLSNLGSSLRTRFQCYGNPSDLKTAILNIEKAVAIMDDGHPSKPSFLSNLGISQQTCFEHLGDLSDLNNAIMNLEKAVGLTGPRNLHKAGYLTNLGATQRIRFKYLGNLLDLEHAISNMEDAVSLTEDGDPSKPACLSNVGIAQKNRFEHLGNLSDLENAILNINKAVELMTDRHPNKPACLSNLGLAQKTRFEHLGHISDLNHAILNMEKATKLTDNENPSKAGHFSNLSIAQNARFGHFGDIADLEHAISNIENAVALLGDKHSFKPALLLNLGIAQSSHFDHLGNFSDLADSISNLEKAIELTDHRHPSRTEWLSCLGATYRTRFEHLGGLSDLESAISNTENAVKLMEDGHPNKPTCLLNLGTAQQTQFLRLGNSSDLESSISNIRRAVELTDDQDPFKASRFANLGTTLEIRFKRHGDSSDLQNAILNLRKAAELMGDENPNKPGCLSNLGKAQATQFTQFGNLSDLNNSILNIGKAVDLTNDGHPNKPGLLANLGNSQQKQFEHVGNIADLKNAITSFENAVKLTNDGHMMVPMCLSNLGHSQLCQFNNSGNVLDLDNAIVNHAKAVMLTDDNDPIKAVRLLKLGISQQTCFQHFNRPADLAACVSSFKAAAKLQAAYPDQALIAAYKWAQTSYLHDDLTSALDGYHTALELLPTVAWLGLDASLQQDWLLQANSGSLGCDAAACAIQLGHFDEAIELLDLGRSVFWQQASSLRGDLRNLKENYPALAAELENVGQELNAGNFSSQSSTTEDNIAGNVQHSQEDIIQKRRHLAGEWKKLVERVRQLPEFQYFLKPIPMPQLRQAFIMGQAIIINVSKYKVDALIFGATGPVEHVPLPDIDYETLANLSADIVFKPLANASATQRQIYVNRFFRPALRTVWNDIIIHIFNKIGIPLTSTTNPLTGTVEPPQHRIWWYSTGPLTFIPIHAAGKKSEAPDVSQLVISSYVTTLQSLFQAHTKIGPVLKEPQGLLGISQSKTPHQPDLPLTMKEVDSMVEVFSSSGWLKENIVCLHGSKATVDSVSQALDSCSWVHFACHGFQDSKVGMQSAFGLHDGHLKLEKIASKILSNGQFAFLSACHAASGLKDLPEEAIHLAAGLQFAGFPSVIATMWSICDVDAPKVADCVYQYLFRNGLQKLDPSEAATALNHAILSLREDPDVTLDRWSSFVHFGI